MKYTLRYLDRAKWIREEEEFEAGSDAEARKIANQILEGKIVSSPILFREERVI